MKGFCLFALAMWGVFCGAVGMYTGNKAGILQDCETKQVLIIDERVFQCVEIELNGEKARGRG